MLIYYKTTTHSSVFILLFLFTIFWSSNITAVPLRWSFEIIAVGDNFSEPALDRGNVAFIVPHGVSSIGGPGVYVQQSSGSIETVADTNTPMPGSLGGLFDFELQNQRPSLSRGGISFVANSTAGGQGVFSTDFSGSLGVSANTNTPIPSGSGPFTSFGTPSLDVITIFSADGSSGQKGIYASPEPRGTLERIVDTNTQIPTSTGDDIGNFVDFGLAPSVNFRVFASTFDWDVAFLGYGHTNAGLFEGIYRTDEIGSDLQAVADEFVAMPGMAGETFSSFFSPVVDNGGEEIAFWGKGTLGSQGIYVADASGQLTVVADTKTPVPSGSGNFQGFCGFLNGRCDGSFPALSNGNVAFVGIDALGKEGIYVYLDDILTELIDVGDLLPFLSPGERIISLSLFHEAMDGNQIAFIADTTEGQAIILATNVPEPSTLALIMLGMSGFSLCYLNKPRKKP